MSVVCSIVDDFYQLSNHFLSRHVANFIVKDFFWLYFQVYKYRNTCSAMQFMRTSQDSSLLQSAQIDTFVFLKFSRGILHSLQRYFSIITTFSPIWVVVGAGGCGGGGGGGAGIAGGGTCGFLWWCSWGLLWWWWWWWCLHFLHFVDLANRLLLPFVIVLSISSYIASPPSCKAIFIVDHNYLVIIRLWYAPARNALYVDDRN